MASSGKAGTTRDGITVERGQKWRDCDKRMDRVRVVVAVADGYALMGRTVHDPHTTKVAIRRMYKHSTGWELVE